MSLGMIFNDPVAQIYMLCVMPWMVAGWLRIPRYVMQFQMAEYKLPNYGFGFAQRERRYGWTFTILLALFVLVPFPCFFPTLVAFGVFDHPIPFALIYLGVWLLALLFSPRGKNAGSHSISSPRTKRILITAFFIEPVLAFLVAWLTGSTYSVFLDPKNSPESMIIAGTAVAALTATVCFTMGPITYILTRYAVLIAAALNTPFDRVLALKRTTIQ